MNYVSTRGDAPILGFCDTVLRGLARDGGLYLPEKFPRLSQSDIRALRGQPYQQIAKTILWPFINNEIDRNDFAKMIDEAYASFRHPAVCPIVQTGANEFILELFHGPTLAFKDVAMQLIGRLMDYILQRQKRRATIVGATSGDTGGAAIEAFANRDNSDIFILFPEGRVSPVQQRQMTTNHSKNVHAIAIKGDFDDCQTLVKALFNDHQFRDDVMLSGVNSINWARIMAQIVYYFSAAISIGAPDRAVSFSVPTGNFGDIFAGFVASRMGLPVARLNIATNDNDILVRTLSTGIYKTRAVESTTSPSMDIQVSSNFERLLYESTGRNSMEVRNAMEGLKQTGEFTLSEMSLKKIKTLFSAGRSTIAETATTIADLYEKCAYLCDPHTAIGIKVGREHMLPPVPLISLATAHPAKFPSAVENASGIVPELPDWMKPIMDKEQRFEVLANDEKTLKHYILSHTRAKR